jgi:hypothetical protein
MEAAAEFCGLDHSLQESPVDAAAKSYSSVNFDHGDGFAELADELRVAIDVNDIDGGQSMLKLEQGLQGFVAESAFAACEQSAGFEQRAAFTLDDPVRNGTFQKNCSHQKHGTAEQQMNTTTGVPDPRHIEHGDACAIAEDEHGKNGGGGHDSRADPALNAMLCFRTGRRHDEILRGFRKV